jgi:hypothetical protein
MPEELWQETTARLAKRRNANCGWKGVPPRRILSGLLRCGACGSSIVSAGSQRGRPMARCSRSIESGDCSGRRDEAMTMLKNELKSHPGDREILQALVSFSRMAGDAKAALGYAEQLALVAPEDRSLAALIQELRQAISAPAQ